MSGISKFKQTIDKLDRGFDKWWDEEGSDLAAICNDKKALMKCAFFALESDKYDEEIKSIEDCEHLHTTHDFGKPVYCWDCGEEL